MLTINNKALEWRNKRYHVQWQVYFRPYFRVYKAIFNFHTELAIGFLRIDWLNNERI